jgi:copper resistance protein C
MAMKRGLLIAAAVAASSLGAFAASAHAFLDHANPAVGSAVPDSPPSVTLWFTQELEPAFSSVTVKNAAGQDVEDGAAVVDPANRAELMVKLKKLPPGTYTVRWHVVSVDTHTTDGDFTFDVGGK